MRIILTFLVILAGAMAYIRLAPVRPGAIEMPSVVGDYPKAGGFVAVRETSTAVNLASFEAAMLALPRTSKVADTPLTFVTRSRVFGFPDVTIATQVGGVLAISGHLVFGKSDLGVNKMRILRILDAL